MGKRRKRMTMARYAKKYAKKREALGFTTPTVQAALIEIDANGQEEKQEEQVQVVTNEPVEEKKEVQTPPWIPEPEPELQVVQIEEPVKDEVVDVETPKPRKKRTTRKKTTTTRRTTKKTEK